jgi:phosphoribosylglycinamide formyltransferase 1
MGSGTGSNARAIVERTVVPQPYTPVLLLTTSSTSGFWSISQDFGIPCVELTGQEATPGEEICNHLASSSVKLLVLAGYMRLLPPSVIQAMEGRVVNIHPALLPRYGGKGMYGIRVHQAVLDAGEMETGATVHWVTEDYDEGAIIAQESILIGDTSTAEELQERVKAVERVLYGRTLSELCRTLL